MTDLLERVKAAAWTDARAWLKLFNPEAVPAPFAPYHRQLAAWPAPGERHARIVFRGAAKSTTTTGTVLWAIHTRRTAGIVWVRAVESDCMGDRRALERLGQRAGLTVEVKASEHLVVVNGVPVWTKTPKGAVRGLKYVTDDGRVVRPDTVIIDDLETRETARSKMQTERLLTWMNADLFATAGYDTPIRVILLGTPITPTSIVAQAMRREPPFDTWTAPMIVPVMDRDGTAAWDAMADRLGDLEQQTEDGAWANEYLLDPLPEGSLLFPPARTRWITPPDVDRAHVWIGVDPAGDGQDATGIVAAASTPIGLAFVDAVQWKGHAEDVPLEVVAMINRLHAQAFTVAGVAVEAVGGFKFLARRIAEEVTPIYTVYEKPRTSKTERATELARWHKQGAVSLVEGLRGSALDVELHTWTREGFTVTGHDDMADAAVWAAGAVTEGWSHPVPHVDTGVVG